MKYLRSIFRPTYLSDHSSSQPSFAKMLPNSLVSVYQEYKKDTDSVASWLVSNAKKHGYTEPLHSPVGNQPEEGGPSKGQARWQDKQQGKASNPTATKGVAKHIIAIRDFIPLAIFISRVWEPEILVPDSFARTINRVIAARSRFGTQLSNHGRGPTPRSDSKHSYFVRVLETVKQILRPLMSPMAKANFDNSFDTMAIRFTGVSGVYEPSQEAQDALDFQRPENASGDDTIYQAEQQTSLEDAVCAFAMMSNDLNKIRTRIKWIWTNYCDGSFDLAVSAVATNTAIELARQLVEDISPIFKAHGDAFVVCEEFFYQSALDRGYSMTESVAWVQRTSRFRPIPPMTARHERYNTAVHSAQDELYDIAVKTYFNSARILVCLATALSPGQLPVFNENIFGIYDPQSSRDGKTDHEKFIEDEIILGEFFREAIYLVRLVPDYPVEDEFIRGIKQLDQTRVVPLFLLFAAQVLLDIHHRLRDGVADAVGLLMHQVSKMRDTLWNYFKLHNNLKPRNWRASDDHALQELHKSISNFVLDPVHSAKEKASPWLTFSTVGEKHLLLKHSPILAGLALYNFRAGMYDSGIAITNAWGSTASLAHLYNAVKQEGLIKIPWSTMERFIAAVGDSNLFAIQRPRHTTDYLKQFLSQMGVDTSFPAFRYDWISGRDRRMQDFLSSNGPRRIKDGVPVSCMFMERNRRKTGQVDWTPQKVYDIVSRSECEIWGREQNDTLIQGQNYGPEWPIRKTNQVPWEQSKEGGRKISHSGWVSPEQLVTSLALALQSETLEFTFPYIAMHRLSWLSLQGMRDLCHHRLSQVFAPDYVTHMSELPFVVGYIFMLADGVNGHNENTLLRMAAEYFDLIAESKSKGFAAKIVEGHNGSYVNISVRGTFDV